MQYFLNHPQAVALIRGGDTAPDLFGIVEFFQKDSCVLVIAHIRGLPKNATGFYGFHIHDGSACTGDAFADSGSHYNPTGAPHPSHAGDLPPLMLCGNMAHLTVLTDRFKVADIIGRTVIVHSDPDDFHTQPSGNAGTKIACGVIKRR